MQTLFDEQMIMTLEILTGSDRESCDKTEKHAYEVFLHLVHTRARIRG